MTYGGTQRNSEALNVTRRHSASLSVTQRHSASLSITQRPALAHLLQVASVDGVRARERGWCVVGQRPTLAYLEQMQSRTIRGDTQR